MIALSTVATSTTVFLVAETVFAAAHVLQHAKYMQPSVAMDMAGVSDHDLAMIIPGFSALGTFWVTGIQ